MCFRRRYAVSTEMVQYFGLSRICFRHTGRNIDYGRCSNHGWNRCQFQVLDALPHKSSVFYCLRAANQDRHDKVISKRCDAISDTGKMNTHFSNAIFDARHTDRFTVGKTDRPGDGLLAAIKVRV